MLKNKAGYNIMYEIIAAQIKAMIHTFSVGGNRLTGEQTTTLLNMLLTINQTLQAIKLLFYLRI
jgi:hypothetical protein